MTKKQRKVRAKVVSAYLNKIFPSPACELNFSNNFELLIAVMLSARCTDRRVNKITQQLFSKYNSPQAFATADQKELERLIYSCGFYAQKAQSIISASKDIVEKFSGNVPSTLEELTSLRGVGRKTANVVMSVGFSLPAIAVDTHVFRVSKRLGLTDAENVLVCEKDLMKLFRREDWAKLHYQMVLYGRYYCKARGSDNWKEDFLAFEKQFLKDNKTE